MTENQLKLRELNQKLGRVLQNIKNLKQHIEFLKKEKMDYLVWEMELNNMSEVERKLEKQIFILEQADEIILGIWEEK